MSPARRWAALAAVIVIAVVGFVIAKSGGSNDKTTKGVVHITVNKSAKPVGGVKTITVNKGQPVRFDVTSAVTDEIHVHGYNFHKDITKPGGKVAFDFPAKIDGEFDIELESRSQQIASLRVQP